MFWIIIILTLCIIVAFITLFIIGCKEDERKRKMMEEMVKTTDDINSIWNQHCPFSESTVKRGLSLHVKYGTDNTAYRKWLKSLPDEYPYQYLNKEKIKKACYGDNMMSMPSKKLIGGLYVMATNGKFYGNFYFMEDGFIFMYNTGGTGKPEKELRRLGCPLPHFQILSMSYHDSFTDYVYSSVVRFDQIIKNDYYKKLKSAVAGRPRWMYQENNNSISAKKTPEAERDKEDFLYITFWTGKDGKQYGNISWGKI